jgi:hypothetical protein
MQRYSAALFIHVDTDFINPTKNERKKIIEPKKK